GGGPCTLGPVDDLADRAWPLDLGDDAIPRERPSHRAFVRPRSDDPDRDPRLLDGRRPERHRIEAVMVAREAEPLAGPQPRQDRQSLIETLGPGARVGRFADVAKARVVGRAEADGQDEPSVREAIQRHRLARELPGTPACRWRDDRAEADALR